MNLLRNAASVARRTLRASNTALLRKCGLLAADWKAELPAEAAFWEAALRDPARNWDTDEFRQRTDEAYELQPELRQLIAAEEGATVRILDVGAGPLTRIGKRWHRRQLDIVALDPLADTYDAILARVGIHPPVRTRRGDGEKLLEQFEANTFDLAYASNALDHSYDPMEAIEQMLAVVKPGRFVYLWHFANEGAAERYKGLHQWNFDIVGGDFLVSDGRTRTSLRARLRTRVELSCEDQRAFGKRVVIATIKKI